MRKMKAAVFSAPGRIVLDEKAVPAVGPGAALIRITTTTICGTDVHILKGEYPVAPGRIVGHEPVGTLDALGPGVAGYCIGQRVIVGAITPCGQCHACLDGHRSQRGGKAIRGWRFGNTIDGTQAEYLLVPHAAANLSPVPARFSDEQVFWELVPAPRCVRGRARRPQDRDHTLPWRQNGCGMRRLINTVVSCETRKAQHAVPRFYDE